MGTSVGIIVAIAVAAAAIIGVVVFGELFQ